MNASLPIEDILIRAAEGDVEQQKIVYKNATICAKKLINECQFDQYESKEILIKCGILAAYNLLLILKNHENMEHDRLKRLAHFPYMYFSIRRQIVVLIKCKARTDLSDYHEILKEIEAAYNEYPR